MSEEKVCTCIDGFRTPGCPVHCSIEEESFGRDVLRITDDAFVAFTFWEGLTFLCPECQVPSIMANEYMGTCCSKCGAKVLIQSNLYNEFIDKKMAKKKGNART